MQTSFDRMWLNGCWLLERWLIISTFIYGGFFFWSFAMGVFLQLVNLHPKRKCTCDWRDQCWERRSRAIIPVCSPMARLAQENHTGKGLKSKFRFHKILRHRIHVTNKSRELSSILRQLLYLREKKVMSMIYFTKIKDKWHLYYLNSDTNHENDTPRIPSVFLFQYHGKRDGPGAHWYHPALLRWILWTSWSHEYKG